MPLESRWLVPGGACDISFRTKAMRISHGFGGLNASHTLFFQQCVVDRWSHVPIGERALVQAGERHVALTQLQLKLIERDGLSFKI